MNAMNERKQRTNGSLKIDWLTDYWPTCWQTHWLTDWPTDRPLTYNYKLTDFWLTDWMPPLTDSMTMKKEGLKCLKWLNIINSVYFCFVLFCSVFFFFRFTATNLYDDTWQHTCVTWENTQGVTKLFKDGQFTGQVTHHDTSNFTLRLAAPWCLDKTKILLAEVFMLKKLFMADWQVSTCGIKFCPKATLPLSTQIAAYLMVLFLTGPY